MSTSEERAAQIRANLHQDMHTTVKTYGVSASSFVAGGTFLNALCDDAMFQIEHLLAEMETLREEISLMRAVAEQT